MSGWATRISGRRAMSQVVAVLLGISPDGPVVLDKVPLRMRLTAKGVEVEPRELHFHNKGSVPIRNLSYVLNVPMFGGTARVPTSSGSLGRAQRNEWDIVLRPGDKCTLYVLASCVFEWEPGEAPL